jgi:hypothetical protein
MGKRRTRYVAKAVGGGAWRVWNTKTQQWWGNPLSQYPTMLLEELNNAKRPEVLIELSKTNRRPQ